MEYERQETARIVAYIYNYGTTTKVSPGTSTKCSIWDPTATAVVDAQAMTEDDTGEFHYDYTSAATAILGVYRGVIVADTSSVVTKQRFTFELIDPSE